MKCSLSHNYSDNWFNYNLLDVLGDSMFSNAITTALLITSFITSSGRSNSSSN
nr:MAG TPA: hypothetical protein [Bacteriophage sp.]